MRRHEDYGRIFLRVGVIAGMIATAVQIFPTGDMHGRTWPRHQPVTTAAMEALFHTEAGAPMVILGQPDVERRRIDNPIVVNKALSFLIYGTTRAEVQRPRSVPAARLAHQHPAALLRLSRDGGPGHAVRRHHGAGRPAALAGPPLPHALDAVGPDARRSLPLHRQYGGLDDRRGRAPAVAGLRADAHRGRLSPRTSPPRMACSRCSATWGFTRCSRFSCCSCFQRQIEHGPGRRRRPSAPSPSPEARRRPWKPSGSSSSP